MIYGYLRVSSDEQDVNSQKQGVDALAVTKGWTICEYIKDEGVSGAKAPDKRNLGSLMERLQKGDIIICSEISRLGRDLFMVMEILHYCMEKEVVIYTVKDNFVLGDNIQCKVLAFAFGLAAEIERQMIRQRTREGLMLRMKEGVLLGRPPGAKTDEDKRKYAHLKDQLLEQYSWGVPLRRIAKNFSIDRNTVSRLLVEFGARGPELKKAAEKAAKQKAAEKLAQRYKDEPYKIVSLDREAMIGYIKEGLTLPQIADRFPEYTYEQVYDTVLCDIEFHTLYRRHGQLKCKKR